MRKNLQALSYCNSDRDEWIFVYIIQLQKTVERTEYMCEDPPVINFCK